MSEIFFNATGLTRQLRGIGTYTLNVLKNWPSKENTTLIGTPEILEELELTDFKVIPSPICKTTVERLTFLQFKLDKLNDSDFFFSPAPEAPMLVKKNQLGLVVHDLIPTLFPHSTSFSLRNYFKYVVPKLARRAKLLIVNSENTAKDVRKYLSPESDPLVVYCGVDQQLFSPTTNPSRDFFLCVSHFDAHKNFESAIDALEMIRDKVPHHLKICGNSSTRYGQEIQEYIKSKDLGDRVEILDHVADDELLALFQNARALVVPSQYEGFGMPVIEAFACRTPVICRQSSSLPEVAGSVGRFFKSNEQLAEHMQQLANAEDSKQFGDSLIERASRFNWQDSAQKIFDAIQRTMQSQ